MCAVTTGQVINEVVVALERGDPTSLMVCFPLITSPVHECGVGAADGVPVGLAVGLTLAGLALGLVVGAAWLLQTFFVQMQPPDLSF